jgi:hypothetical protein
MHRNVTECYIMLLTILTFYMGLFLRNYTEHKHRLTLALVTEDLPLSLNNFNTSLIKSLF